jgi:hypothetical protein
MWRRWLAADRVSAVVIGALALGVGPAQPAAAQQDGKPGDTLQSALQVKTDQTYSGTLETTGAIHVYRLDVGAGVQAIRIGIAQTNHVCEAWASLVNGAGTALNRVFAPRSGTSLTQTSVGVSTYFLVVDDGPLVDCAGAAYVADFHVVSVVLGPLGAIPSAAAAPRANARSTLGCIAYATAASKAATVRQRLLHQLGGARGARRRSLRRRIRSMGHKYRRYARLERTWCSRARLR